MDKNQIGIACVMLPEERLRSSKTYTAALQARFPGKAIKVHDAKSDTVRALQIDECHIYLALMPPVPWSQLESLTKNSWHWKESASQLKDHKAHILVTLMNAPEDVIERAIMLTRVTAAVLDVQETIGVYWHGPAISQSSVFKSFADDLDKTFPVLSWISYAIVKEPAGVAIVTQGLDQLGHRELELIASPGDGSVVEYAMDLTLYLLRNGPILKHGQTVGRTASEKFSITHRPWRWDKTKGAVVIDMRKGGGSAKGFFGRLLGK